MYPNGRWRSPLAWFLWTWTLGLWFWYCWEGMPWNMNTRPLMILLGRNALETFRSSLPTREVVRFLKCPLGIWLQEAALYQQPVFFNWRNFAKSKGLNFFKNSKMKWFWRFYIARSEKKNVEMIRFLYFVFCVVKNIERWLRICS